MNMVLRTLAAATMVAGISTTALAQDELAFGIISTESQQNLRPKWEPFLADMEEKTGLAVKPFFASDYAGVIEGMRFDKVQLAWYGNKSAMEAVDRANGEIFAQTVDISGNPGYWSLVLAPKDSPLEKVEDLLTCDQSLNFGLGDPNSTSGYLVPMTFVFAANGVDPKECFKNVTNANHETNAMAVANGQVDAAANNTESLALIEKNNPDAFAKIKVIWKSPLIPADPIVWNTNLPQESKDKIREFFVTYGTDQSTGDVAHEKEVLAGLEWAPFVASTNDQLLPIRVMELSKTIAQIEADESRSAEEKTAEIEKLEAEKAGYEKKIKSAPQS
ncbi:MAG: phosphonate ABC transporter substrate-binding protein [Aurantimonas coralicida]|uniref:phosphonate ABC transporter substrate-binding protein n=1 Tax=Aurantimonas coralicida TaxID=182270 RepID=UPI000421A8DF|nr:phosphonate ABC transporter substrate-binding protein [Aurantimonas coralicida]MAY30852.1 phosphonate ABC transporter substrate-binding protein [Aurantimonas sp.]MCC4299968.1 phosphonate ABC transporter substrate-binding protein [Aurantimonas coralicida]MCD1642057.1 phosphonate ABC transporter substrate-binding protein [Aurantimonas coralicida]MCW7545911.1 phosphonate ABC transporter substrate-binding protein [Aurantimonas litoralis]